MAKSLRDEVVLCPRRKCGEYNMLRCVRYSGHTGDCCFVVDHENDYLSNRKANQADAILSTEAMA